GRSDGTGLDVHHAWPARPRRWVSLWLIMSAPHLNYSSASPAASSRVRARLVIHAYDELILALERGDAARSRQILTGLTHSLALEARPGLAVSLAGLYARFRELVRDPSETTVVLHAIRHLRDVWAHAAQIDENSFRPA